MGQGMLVVAVFCMFGVGFYIANKIKVCYLINRIYSKTKF